MYLHTGSKNVSFALVSSNLDRFLRGLLVSDAADVITRHFLLPQYSQSTAITEFLTVNNSRTSGVQHMIIKSLFENLYFQLW